MTDRREGLPFYRGCVRVERRGLPFYRGGLRHDRRRRSAVRLIHAGNSSPAHGFCGARILSTLCSLRIARSVFVGRGLAPAVLHRHAVVYRRTVGSSLCRVSTLFGRWLCPLIVFRFVRPTNFVCRFAFCFPDARGSAPRAPRKPAGARLDRALFLAHSFVFLLHFVGRLSDR